MVYETFYKSYNPKKADRLGVVYTPNEIVRFMIESTDYLLQKHFGRMLEDKGVEILDPATGTGTFICDLIDHISKDKLEHKYRNEMHANEVEILPYYIANLNIEFTYKQKTGKYLEFENLCFVDTLDNYVNLNSGAETDIFSLTDENSERIKRQNEKKISVIIGNPPYNANQMNENENNKNREYPQIDKRIKDTYIKQSTAQKAKSYDMYRRFYRWAMDRVDENGIIAFITNRSFIDAREADGFRKCVLDEFDYAYIVDTKSDVRQNPKIAGTSHNVFGIQTGVAIMFLIKKAVKENPACRISYWTMQDEWRKEDKLQWLTENKLDKIDFANIVPDKNNNWINLVENDWDKMIPVSTTLTDKSIFAFNTLGVSTNRDEWVYGINTELLVKKINYFVIEYNRMLDNGFQETTIKWSDSLKTNYKQGNRLVLQKEHVIPVQFRPYVRQSYYSDKNLSDRLTHNHYTAFGVDLQTKNPCINYTYKTSSKPFSLLVSMTICDLHFLGDTQCLPYALYNKDGTRHDNITDWALQQFREHYQDEKLGKEDIFHYVYGVLHDPAYRKKYEINLKRSLPRVPFQKDFRLWAGMGKDLMDLHLGFESAEPYPLELRTILPDDDAEGYVPKAKLKADKLRGTIILDEHTSLHGIPDSAWEYKLGNRSALEWILDQYKEKKPKDPTIARLFNTYRFADYKDKVIDLLKRVCAVSVKTMEIVREMES